MPEPPRSANVLVSMLHADPTLLDKAKARPKVLDDLAATVTENLPQPALIGDPWVYRLVVVILGAVAVIAAVASFKAVGAEGVKIPDTLTALGSAAIGALAGLLAPSPVRS